MLGGHHDLFLIFSCEFTVLRGYPRGPCSKRNVMEKRGVLCSAYRWKPSRYRTMLLQVNKVLIDTTNDPGDSLSLDAFQF